MTWSLVTETNRYAQQTLCSKQLSPKSRFHRWVDVTGSEMWAFLGLIVSMGLIVIDYLEDYWSTDCMYKLPFYSAVMKKERFCLILSFLHLFNNEDQVPRGQPGHDPIFKIRRSVDRLRKNFKNVFGPGDKVAVDEAMVA